MSDGNNRNSLMDCLMNRKVAVSVLVAVFVMVGLVSPAIAQASTDAVLILHFDEGSGTIAKDESGYGNDGSIHGIKWVEGKYGKALEFDGKDDYVEVPHSDSLDITGNLAVVAWVKFDRLESDGYDHIFDNSYYGYDWGNCKYEGYHLSHYADNIVFNVRYGSEQVSATYQISNLNTGQWYHIVGTIDDAYVRLYIDGTLVDTTASNGNYPKYCHSFNAYIGRDWSNTYHFDGIIDEIRIYNRALTADEIKTHYEGKQPALTLTKSASPSTIQEGETTMITIRVKNTGTGDAKSIEVTDTIPTGFKIISGSKSASFDKIKPGDYRTFEYTLKATGSGKFTCEPATATYKDADGNSYSAASNSVSIQVGGEVPVGADSDGDGWSDEKEKEMGTNPYSVDSDGDGLKDPEDPNPTVPEKKTPGFEVVFAIAGILAVAYLLRRKG